MARTLHNGNEMVVDLKNGILFHTNIPPENHAALRSGFAGYPANPRWNIHKFQAWKTGHQLCQALKQGQLVVRSSDCMLVASEDEIEPQSTHQLSNKNKQSIWTQTIKQVFTSYQVAQQ
ncbi:conserved hypothetical protein [Rippkaea orientalis PCC 8801]|uniref:Uncharacterized protein n=1 Tax=Rippkaea orientalis (strain PCC 8801 / RF-1) TaxID=41431 RepID=B7JZA9_RIPO1|nr:hypothetical protein [Rippkaea orientalis]ACK67320.1 conserved hypothetical protein [Rippkaea orientalis PCC 8801]